MTTLSRAAVRGALAVPRMRPLGDPTLSFGGEWRFSLPEFDFRSGFPALYAAVLETFCVNRWRNIDTPAVERPEETQASSPARSAAPISAASQAAPIAPPSPVRPIAAVIRSTPRERKIGAACALAGAAMLSWIVLSHLPPSFTEQHAARSRPEPGGTAEDLIKPVGPPIQVAAATNTPATADTQQTAVAQVRGKAASTAVVSKPIAVAATSQATKDVPPVETRSNQRVAAASAPTIAEASGKSETKNVAQAEARVAQRPAIASAQAAVAAKDKPATKLASALPPAPRPALSTPSEEHVPMPRHPAKRASRSDTAVSRPPLPATLPPTKHVYADQASERTAGQSVAAASNMQQATSQAAARAKPDAASAAVAATKPAAQPRNYAAQIPGYAKDTTWVNHVTHRRITDSPDQFGM